MSRATLSVKLTAGALVFGGVVCLLLAPIIGGSAFDSLWGVEPLSYIGAILLIVGLGGAAAVYAAPELANRRGNYLTPAEETHRWAETTQQYFQLFDHDLGRPLRRIAGKERELRAVLLSSEQPVDPAVKDLLDEIERQTPNFRLMLSNMQVLIQLEAPEGADLPGPVEPSEVVRRIADRYTPVASEVDKEVTWWAEPAEFGLVYADASAIEHIVTNLVDNAVRFADTHVEVKLTRNPTHFFVRVWDDGPGIGAQYVHHLFDRGWTPEVGRREEKTSSGLGLFIARTLARRSGGDLTVESAPGPDNARHTAFLLSLPLRAAPE